ncbi:hypothetical protein [Parvularcula sp. LCG005]|uniref:hypothetical protein n=1 Tax=Parvularcula sp. LCG005 TaxID=3078805 RepID=UPI002943D0B5|nr:hypothetical protein [Parvularcula sp. LCG005]WOI53031.1 hypothetical protein RUI03_12830 [Parvularcula sp. LCG005]WOI53045.1 hypothetical protein RUI03_12905 [Parvularcula sp. LCG005]
MTDGENQLKQGENTLRDRIMELQTLDTNAVKAEGKYVDTLSAFYASTLNAMAEIQENLNFQDSLDDLLKEHDIKVNQPADLPKKIARLITRHNDEKGRRSSDMAKALRAAEQYFNLSAEGSALTNDQVKNWLQESGGLQAIIRSTDSASQNDEGRDNEDGGNSRENKGRSNKSKKSAADRRKALLNIIDTDEIFEAEFTPEGSNDGDIIVMYGHIKAGGRVGFTYMGYGKKDTFDPYRPEKAKLRAVDSANFDIDALFTCKSDATRKNLLENANLASIGARGVRTDGAPSSLSDEVSA